MAGRAGFVGREDELSRLLGALGGDARLVLVVGDGGVGKTRFVAEGIALPRCYVQAIDALYLVGDRQRAGVLAQEAHRYFANHVDPATAAVVCHRAAFFRTLDAAAAGLPLMQEALRLFELTPPSYDHAHALLD